MQKGFILLYLRVKVRFLLAAGFAKAFAPRRLPLYGRAPQDPHNWGPLNTYKPGVLSVWVP